MFRFIVVDDCVSDMDGICNIINWSAIGFELVGTAVNGEEGLKLALEKKPDLVITDVSMPKIDGIEMASRIKSKLPDTKFIVMSCYDEFEYARRAILEGICNYILKPIDVDELVETSLRIKEMKDEIVEKQLQEYKIQQQIQKNLDILKEYFLLNLSYKRAYDKENIYQQAKQLGINPDSPFRIIIVNLNGNKEKNTYHSEFVAKEIFKNNLLNTFEGTTFFRGYDLLSIIVWTDDIKILKEKLLMCSSLLQNDGISSSIALSSSVNSIFDLYESFENIYKIGLASLGQFGSVIIQENFHENKVLELNISNIMDEIRELFNENDEGKIKLFIEKYMCSENINKKSFVYSVLSMICIILSERGDDIEAVFGTSADLWKKVALFDNDFTLKIWIQNILVFINRHIFTDQNDKHAKSISIIKHFIDENYNKNISIQDIADTVNMSISYTHRLFKKYTNETINDYLTKKRMTAAAKLLKDHTLKMHEISNMVGYDSSSYFSAVFKNFYKLSPTEYRYGTNVNNAY